MKKLLLCLTVAIIYLLPHAPSALALTTVTHSFTYPNMTPITSLVEPNLTFSATDPGAVHISGNALRMYAVIPPGPATTNVVTIQLTAPAVGVELSYRKWGNCVFTDQIRVFNGPTEVAMWSASGCPPLQNQTYTGTLDRLEFTINGVNIDLIELDELRLHYNDALLSEGVCNLDNLDVTISAGDGPFNITGTGPGLPANGVAAGTTILTGPGNWTGVTVTEIAGDLETTNLGNFNCATVPLAATAICNLDNLDVTITAGDGPFNITGTGPGLPLNGVAAGTYSLTGPGTWTGVTVTETGGNTQTTNLGTFNCTTNGLTVAAICNLDNLVVTITTGDTPFNITGTGPGLPLNGVAAGTYTLTGPGTWTGVTVIETTGNTQSTNLGDFNCATNALAATAVCNLDNLVVTITAGDTPFNITGTGPGLPLNGVSAGTYPLTGPGTWTGVTVTETMGNAQSTALGDFNCATTGLNVAAQCVGDNLLVTIYNGDAPFNVTGTGPGLPLNNVAASTVVLTGPAAWTGLTVTELGGNTQTFAVGNFACQAAGIPVPNLGLIKIDTGQAQFALQSPNGQPMTLANGTPILLPADADHNGFDTYTVTGIYWIDGDYWLSIFLGNTTWGWVPLDDITSLTPLNLPDPATDSSGGKS